MSLFGYGDVGPLRNRYAAYRAVTPSTGRTTCASPIEISELTR